MVTLKGRPDMAVMNGLKRTPQGRPLIEPKSEKRWRGFNAKRPYSPARSYWLTGNVPALSVSLCAPLRV